MFPWLKTRGCEVALHLTTYMFQVAEIIGTGFIAQWLETWDSPLG